VLRSEVALGADSEVQGIQMAERKEGEEGWFWRPSFAVEIVYQISVELFIDLRNPLSNIGNEWYQNNNFPTLLIAPFPVGILHGVPYPLTIDHSHQTHQFSASSKAS